MSNILSTIRARTGSTTLHDLFNSEYENRKTEFKEDPLVLACALKALFEQHERYYKFENAEVAEHVTDEIRDKAEAVRKYYTKKWFWSSLNNRQLSDFRSRAHHLLENRIRTCNDRDSGIYYKLPWFYDEDVIYDEFKKSYNTTDVPQIKYGSNTKELLNLTFLKSTVSRQQKRKLERFWFTDEKYLYSIDVLQDNPLIEMFRDILSRNSSVKINTYRSVDRIDNMYYYRLFKFNFVKEENA